MYVRFKVRARKSKGKGKKALRTFHVVLVESSRESGNPRQRIVAYLGSIREEEFSIIQKRYNFLNKLRGKLDALDLDYWTIWELKVKMIRLFQKKPPQ
jgi:hypothetical protein